VNIRRVIARAVHGHGEPGPAHKRDLADMEALLPAEMDAARLTNVAMMELGALVCTARAPKCDDCPLASQCAWRLAGYPAFEGKRAPVQKKFEGSDRQVRGLILAELRASEVPVRQDEIDAVWPDAAQRSRALAGLVADGLAVGSPAAGYTLPDS
jgi:A/G-specific adenine glycosylase